MDYNKPLPSRITNGDKYDPAMAIMSECDAAQYFERLVEHNMLSGTIREEAERIERSNLAFIAGYYDHETRLRVERLFKCTHPVFGAAANGEPTAQEAFDAGVKAATAYRG